MAGILWVIAAIVFIIWLAGLVLAHLGGLFHILLLIALVVVVYNLVTRNRSAV